ncbi:MAG: A/G-specific adenine glycosylase [Bacteroidales bacterium]|nr:A/G-specific adenine glycosylase [Bacteroidales bacterium]
MDDLQTTLATWFEANKRELPWRTDPTPYHVWLSEVILQQTRVNQGLDYFNRFVGRWPTLMDLAHSSEEEVLKMWQGLGYYSRARNLYKCARQVASDYGGTFPADYDKLLGLKGIGSYTAAAIASIAFGLPHAVIDGNVYRVLSRLYDIDTPINKEAGVKLFASLADELLDRTNPGRHNQAMMEFGALHCTPRNPDCVSCPLQSHCLAFAHGTVEQRPQKEKKLSVRTRYFSYLVIIDPRQQLYLRKRGPKDIWENLYDFPCIESDHPMSTDEVVDQKGFKDFCPGDDYTIQSVSSSMTHKLSHQTIVATFFEIKINSFLPIIQTKNILLVPETELGSFPVPKLIENYINILQPQQWQA